MCIFLKGNNTFKLNKRDNYWIPPKYIHNFFFNGWLLFEKHHKFDNNNNTLMSLLWYHNF
jgi:protein tyrosine phosphatase